MEIIELFEKDKIDLTADADQKFKDYLANHYHNDLYLLATQKPSKSDMDKFDIYFIEFHTKAIKMKASSDASIDQDITSYHSEIEKLRKAYHDFHNIISEWIKTEKEVNNRICDASRALTIHRDAINRNNNGAHKDTIQHFVIAAKTCAGALPKTMDLKDLEGLKKFIIELNQLFTSQNIIDRFTSFAHITVDYMKFNEAITNFVKNSQLSREDVNAFTVNLSAPIQRLTRLLALSNTLLDKKFSQLLNRDIKFKKELQSVNRKLLRVCGLINQLQKMYEHENNMRNGSSPIAKAIARFLTLISQYNISSTMTSQSTGHVVQGALLFSSIKRKPEQQMAFISQSQQESNEEDNDVAKSIMTMAMQEESSTSDDVEVNESFYSELDKIARDLTPVIGLLSSSNNSNSQDTLRNSTQISSASLPTSISSSAPVTRQSSSASLTSSSSPTPTAEAKRQSLNVSSTGLAERNIAPVLEPPPATTRQSSRASLMTSTSAINAQATTMEPTPAAAATRDSSRASLTIPPAQNARLTSSIVNSDPSLNESTVSEIRDNTSFIVQNQANKKTQDQKNANLKKWIENNKKILEDYLVHIEEENERLLVNYAAISGKKKNLTDEEKKLRSEYKAYEKQKELIRNVLKKYQELPQALQDVAHAYQIDLHARVNSMFNILINRNFDFKTKIQAIAEFETKAKEYIPVSQRSKKKIAISSFILACCCATGTAFLGLSLVALLTALAGPGPGVVALFLTAKGVTTTWAIAITASAGGTAVVSSLLGAYGFYKQNNEAKPLTDAARDLAKEKPKPLTY